MNITIFVGLTTAIAAGAATIIYDIYAHITYRPQVPRWAWAPIVATLGLLCVGLWVDLWTS